MPIKYSRKDFPEGFKFGAATAAYQIEGLENGNCGTSHWDTFSMTPGNVHSGENGSIACDHFHRFEEDLDLVQALIHLVLLLRQVLSVALRVT